MICEALDSPPYFDKDDLGILLRRAFTFCGEDVNMDGVLQSFSPTPR